MERKVPCRNVVTMKKKDASENYLDYVPVCREGCRFDISEDGKVVILVENKGAFHWLARKLFRRPRISHIHLDEMGNFIWPLMDGERSVHDIALLVREEFGERAEPLYKRLVQYMKNLESYGFVRLDMK